jgi:DNA segregation ATPase FtsK/SpoIIIE-like protein
MSKKTSLEKDPLFDQAAELVRNRNQACVSLLQRNLRISYSHALRLMADLEGHAVTTADTYGHRQVIPAN